MSTPPRPDRVDAAELGLPAVPQPVPPDEFDRAYSVIAYTMNRYIVDHMLRASRFFDHDSETMMLFGILAHLNVAHVLPPGTRPSERLARDGSVPGDPQAMLRPVRLRDLVAVTGRPRETIRRRLERLREAGRVCRIDDGWVLELAGADDLRSLTLESARRFLATASAMVAALEDAEQALRPHAKRRPKWADHPLRARRTP